jgi:predicted acyl esterase
MRRLLLAAVLGVLALAAPAQAQNRQAELCQGWGNFSEPPPPWAEKLTPAQETTFSTEEVQIESADGTLVSARVYKPDAYEGRRLPTVVVMSPYHALLGYYKEQEDIEGTPADCITPFLLQRGYAVVLADMRGTHNSDSCFDYGGKGDQEDGYATVQWIAGQGWSNGNVGMYGVSHVGMSQYAAAVLNPPALKAIIPIAPITSFWRYLYSGGVHYETNMATPAAYHYGVGAPPPTNVGDPNWAANVAGTGCGSEQVVDGTNPDGVMTDFWKERDYPSKAANIHAAVFAVHGTLDENVKTDHFGTIWEALERHDVTRKALLGPWGHQEPQVENWHLMALRWYEHWLRGIDTGYMAEPTVTMIDQTGENTRFADTFAPDPAGTRVLEAGAGKLADAVAPGEASYQDIPGMRRANVRSTATARVIYTSAPVADQLRISGTPVMEIVAAIDKSSTHFAVQLFDVDSAGQATYITRGYLDSKLRGGFDKPAPVTPGEANRYRIELHPREWVLAPGHSLQVMLAASDSCAWSADPECNSSGVVSDTTAARTTVVEGPGQTRLLVPTAPVVEYVRKPRPVAGPAPGAERAKPGASAPKRALQVKVRRLRGGRVRVSGTAPAGSRVLVKVKAGRRTITRRVTAKRGRFTFVVKARGRVRATATLR